LDGVVKPSRSIALSRTELRKRAARIALVLTDSDGVLTDTGVYYSESGEALKRFSIRDGMGVELLRNAGIETAIITGEQSGSVARRSEKLGLPHLYLGVKDKRRQLDEIIAETGITMEHIAFIGDDVNDLEIIGAIGKTGLTGAPVDAMPQVSRRVHYCCRARGGHGAFRDFADWLLSLRGADRPPRATSRRNI
jgi:3-deoxy-D-manno-octulosonate 8-phosphate phosphatase (KDO 8-P phosphatase)